MNSARKLLFKLTAFTYISLILSGCLVGQSLSPQQLQAKLTSDLVGNVVALRNFYSFDELHYDSAGAVLGNPAIGVWALDGSLAPTKVRVTKNEITIEGKRVVVMGSGKTRDTYTTTNRKIKIHIARLSGNDELRAVQAVFMANGENLVDLVPAFWRYSVRQMQRVRQGLPQEDISSVGSFSSKGEPTIDAGSDLVRNRLQLGKTIDAPKMTVTPDPEFTEFARNHNYQGTVVLWCVISKEGVPENIMITRWLGAGLDEQAVRAVQKWRFRPALKNGEPVAVPINIDVNFRLW